MMKEWINSVIFVALIPLLGWMGLQLYEMKPTVFETSRRVDRIVDVPPEVKIHIAQEDMQKRVKLALLAADPFEISSGKWITRLHFLDFGAGRVKNYVISPQRAHGMSVAFFINRLSKWFGFGKIFLHAFSSPPHYS